MTGTTCVAETVRVPTVTLSVSAPRLAFQMTPLVAKPYDAVTYPIPNRVITDDYIGNFHYGITTTGTSGPYSLTFSDPITTGGQTHRLENWGDHWTVTFNFRPQHVVYYDEFCSDDQLDFMTDTTTFPLDQVYKWTKYELYKYLYNHEKRVRLDTGAPVPSLWRQKAIEAKREAERNEYEPKMIQVHGRA